ncbi:MAG: hypothetical protein MZV64_49080 [Ignavibacteriales bacterium]|nr:hypothetical protein [Ignavibacteriales bacterium]
MLRLKSMGLEGHKDCGHRRRLDRRSRTRIARFLVRGRRSVGGHDAQTSEPRLHAPVRTH